MELSLNNGFSELSFDEMEQVDGGVIGIIIGIVVTAVVTIGLTAGNEYLKDETGKGVGGWICYGAGTVINEVGKEISKLGRAIA